MGSYTTQLPCGTFITWEQTKIPGFPILELQLSRDDKRGILGFRTFSNGPDLDVRSIAMDTKGLRPLAQYLNDIADKLKLPNPNERRNESDDYFTQFAYRMGITRIQAIQRLTSLIGLSPRLAMDAEVVREANTIPDSRYVTADRWHNAQAEIRILKQHLQKSEEEERALRETNNKLTARLAAIREASGRDI
jgi:hypothetical protein